MNLGSALGALGVAIAVCVATPSYAHGAGDIVKPNFQREITNVPGKSLIAVEVVYPPGSASVPHTHAKSAFIYAYVVSGAVESQVNDGPKRLFRTGESFYEEPGSTHAVSRNASKTKPARLLAVFVVDTHDADLTTPLKQGMPQ